MVFLNEENEIFTVVEVLVHEVLPEETIQSIPSQTQCKAFQASELSPQRESNCTASSDGVGGPVSSGRTCGTSRNEHNPRPRPCRGSRPRITGGL